MAENLPSLHSPPLNHFSSYFCFRKMLKGMKLLYFTIVVSVVFYTLGLYAQMILKAMNCDHYRCLPTFGGKEDKQCGKDGTLSATRHLQASNERHENSQVYCSRTTRIVWTLGLRICAAIPNFKLLSTPWA